MKPLVSIIVPIYNTEKYLPRCLDSLSKQSLKDIEIILIDNASTDKCSTICDAYVNKDGRFKAFHNERNYGSAAARNLGIKMATTDYLMFVDSDDWVHEDYCKIPYECAIRYKVDLVMFGFQRLFGYDSGLCGKNNSKMLPVGFKDKIEAIDILTHNAGNGPCNKLYRKHLFKSISFPEGFFYEDAGTIYKLVWNADSIYCVDKVLYFYCYRPNSVTTLKTEKAVKDWYNMHMQQYNDLLTWGYPSEKLDLLIRDIALEYCMCKKRDIYDSDYLFCAKVLQKNRSVLTNLTWRRKIVLYLFKCCPLAFEFICMLFGRKYSD